MIVIRLEMWPKGDHTKARELGIGVIANIGGSAALGDYDCILLKSPEYSKKNANRPMAERCNRPRMAEIWRRSKVSGFPRGHTHGPWDLVFRALGRMLSNRNPGVEFDAEVMGDAPLFGTRHAPKGWAEPGE